MARESKGNDFTSQSSQSCVSYTLLLLLVCSDSFREALAYIRGFT